MPPQGGCWLQPAAGLGSTTAAASTAALSAKPPLPTGLSVVSQQIRGIEVQLPPLVAGGLVAAFAKAVADGLDNELMAHYYLSGQRVRVNLDRAVDRLLAEFVRHLWDELYDFYKNASRDEEESRTQVSRLFNGPIRQIILLLNGPETSQCILSHLGPGLSQRSPTWSKMARGIDLLLALQLVCGYWHREFPSLSPGGIPEEIARAIHIRIFEGAAARNLIHNIRRVLLSPHFVQMHIMESAMWDIVLRRRRPPPRDGFHVVQFRFECQLFGPVDGVGDQQSVDIGSLPAVTGSPNDCIYTTASEYIEKQFPRCGPLVLRSLNAAITSASNAGREGRPFEGMSIWDGSDGKGVFCPGLRLLHFDVEAACIRLSVSAWTHALIEVFQQMAWMCAALSASPFPGVMSECAVEVADWEYAEESTYVNCSLAHRQIPDGDGLPWLRELGGVAIASGFPIDSSVPAALS